MGNLLPDDIIWYIVSRYLASPTLTNKEAIQLGLSSKAIFRQVQNRPILMYHGYDQELDYIHKTLRRYEDEDVNLETFTFETWYNCRNPIQDECINLAAKRSLKTLNLYTPVPDDDDDYVRLTLPESVYGVESLVQLSLRGWKLRPTTRIAWRNLKQLCLHSVDVGFKVLEDVLSSCPLIENLEINLEWCMAFSCYYKVRVSNLHNLKKLSIRPRSISGSIFLFSSITSISGDSDMFEVSGSPNVESIALSHYRTRFIIPGQLEYQNLRTLSLDFCRGICIGLPFADFASEFPRLEELYIGNDPTLERIRILSPCPSLKKIRLVNMPSLKQARFDVPNVVLFEFECSYEYYHKRVGKGKLLPELSFIGIPDGWLPNVTVRSFHPDLTSQLDKEREKFTVHLNGSKVSLPLGDPTMMNETDWEGTCYQSNIVVSK